MENSYDIIDVKRLFIQQSYEDNWRIYEQSLETATIAGWDYVIITASNERQAKAYEIQINERIQDGLIPRGMKCLVISDPDGERVGSGGATLNALCQIYEKVKFDIEDFKKLRILIIHSGGDSKRVPQYSAIGKLFSPVPRELPDNRFSTLFDELLVAFAGLPTRMDSGVVIASGDILMLFNHMQADLMREGAIGLSIKVYANEGSNHGVFYTDKSGRVCKFLHKVPVERLRSEGAVNAIGMVDVDTGAFWLSSSVAASFLKLVCNSNGNIDESKINKYINKKVRLSFYADFIMPMTSECNFEEYLCEPGEASRCIERDECRKEIWNALKVHKLYVQRFSPAEFIHFGTTHQLRETMTSANKVHNHLNWSNNVLSSGAVENSTIINSEIDDETTIGMECFIENSTIGKGVKIGSGAILSGCVLSNCENIAQDIVWQMLPVVIENENGYVLRVYGVMDNPKDDLRFSSALFARRLITWINDNKITYDSLWEDVEINLWTAKLYPVCKTISEAAYWAQKLQNAVMGKEKIDIEKWISMKRMSLLSSFEHADISQIMNQVKNISDSARAHRFTKALTLGVAAKKAINYLGKREVAERSMTKVLESIEDGSIIGMSNKMRIYCALAEASKILRIKKIKFTPINLENFCFNEVNKAICDNLMNGISDIKKLSIIKEKAEVSLPVRINIGGEWSDAAPYSLEHGGTVINLAVTLNGKLPIRARVCRLDKAVIKLASVDCGITSEVDSISELLKYDNPSDPFVLHKAALVVCGVIPRREAADNISLQEIIDALGGGLYIETNVQDIPKGSGLGTSSILAAATIMAIREVLGIPQNNQEIFKQVFALEQLMTTGGGWQDQAGGVIPGIKLLTTKPGIEQNINAELIKISDETLNELNSRLVLIYTGQRRLAKSILRSIMGKYILNDPQTIEILHEIQKLSVLMKFELEKGNLDSLGKIMTEHSNLIRRLDSGSSNTCIDLIIKVAEPYLSGVMFCGAAGGGFLVGILRDSSMKEELSTILCEVFQDTQVGLWNCEIYNG